MPLYLIDSTGKPVPIHDCARHALTGFIASCAALVDREVAP